MRPRYAQIADDLRGKIERSEEGWQIGDKIPSLRQIQTSYPWASRGTISLGIDQLVKESMLSTDPRIGTTVISTTPTAPVTPDPEPVPEPKSDPALEAFREIMAWAARGEKARLAGRLT